VPAGAFRIVLALGNPGPDYELTRHNVGFRVADVLSAAHGIRVARRRAKCLLGEGVIAGREVVLAKPQTFMNNSGRAAVALLEAYGAGLEEMLVVCDDFNLELGGLRARRSGSSGGQKGLASIIEAVGSEDFARLRVGIGPLKGDPVDFVLTRFRKRESAALGEAVEKAAGACAVWVAGGIDACMNAYN
jgi:PTH1 family peptidyl-tRNA hydrolase